MSLNTDAEALADLQTRFKAIFKEKWDLAVPKFHAGNSTEIDLFISETKYVWPDGTSIPRFQIGALIMSDEVMISLADHTPWGLIDVTRDTIKCNATTDVAVMFDLIDACFGEVASF
jgi:hypothetical protein